MTKLRAPGSGADRLHSSHWGTFLVTRDGDRIKVRPNPLDPDPSPILRNIVDAPRHPSRVAQPVIRRGWLERGPVPDATRGRDEYVPVSWSDALDLTAAEFSRIRREYGCQAIFGGSYGWSSAGRFHHAQSQIHRFLNCLGGYTASVNTYSAGAAEVILPHVMGSYECARFGATWPDIVAATELVVAFGGMPRKNSNVGPGGIGRHEIKASLAAARARGTQFVLVSPIRDDLPGELSAEWLPVLPGTDVALMLGIAHTLIAEHLHDQTFLQRCCVGFDKFEAYVLGLTDSEVKSAEWAGAICGIGAERIRALARQMSRRTTLVSVSHSLQRAEHGEQPVWLGMVLAAMIGAIGIKGGGYAYSLGAFAQVGRLRPVVSPPPLPQGRNGVRSFIPVARIADMLLNPGETFDYNGRTLSYPDIRLIHWAGGNPFHHHQDLRRLRSAFSRPDTIIVHEPFWTATACHADIVLPSTITLERNDIGGVSSDNFVIAMHQAIEPYASAKDDYEILAELARRLDVEPAFTEGRSSGEWIRHMYAQLQASLTQAGYSAPDFEEFWAAGELELPTREENALRRFRADPESARLNTPSGKLEIYSERIAAFGYHDCPGHPVWIAPDEWLGAPGEKPYPLQLVANQPRGRLHSQLDFGAFSQETKIDGREVMRMHPVDATGRGIRDRDLVKIFNLRGAFLAVAQLTVEVRPGVVQVPTGAWYDPVLVADGGEEICVGGNPNTVTRDVGTSRLAQGCTGQLCLVEVVRFVGKPPCGRGHRAPGPTARA